MRSEWFRKGRYSLLWRKRHRYDNIIMGFLWRGRIQAYLISNNNYPSVPDDIIPERALQCARLFDRSTSRCSHGLFELNFHHFPPPPLSACLRIICLVCFSPLPSLVTVFSPPLLKRYLFIIYWQILKIKFFTSLVTKFSQPNSTLCLISDLLSKRVRRHAELWVTQSFQRPSYRKNAFI